ncbi:hypothetical protein M2281_001937 [Mesorhizobium soli]|uniref:DUF3329 domain-containing protein n=1 Tax=Pseudaminobacter soli (ex Li et al. 2025) TaxID=1295366 RepID=UPI002475F5F6|nr:DUF3329 domain-containing protein [Mesorhizobium soli]MDH6231365.1 hypothetical protein [Mesorhizobium soli]
MKTASLHRGWPDLTKDSEHPFFRPLWRRIAVVVVCLAWAALEFVNGASSWGVIALCFAGYAVWQFFLAYSPPAGPGKEE